MNSTEKSIVPQEATTFNIDPALFRCRLTGRQIEPQPYTLVEHRGFRWAWFPCTDCDKDEHPRGHPDFDPTWPGPHVMELGQIEPGPACTCFETPAEVRVHSCRPRRWAAQESLL
jgi:hypothetical protein